MNHDDTGMAEIISEILIISLIIGMAIMILIMVSGMSLPMKKTAYLATSAEVIDISNNSIVRLNHNQGDPASLYPSTSYGNPLQVVMTNGTVTYTAVPLQSSLTKGWRSGESRYLVHNSTGLILSDNPLSVPGNTGFFPGAWTVSIIDKTSDVMIAQHTVILKGNASSTPTAYTRYPGFTVEAWVRWNIPPNPGSDTTKKWATVVVDGTTDNNRRYHLQHNSDNTKFEFALATATTTGSGTWVASTTTPASGTWYYVTGVYNQTPGTMTIFVNGASQSTQTVGSAGLRASPGKYQVGGPAGIQWPGPTSMLRKLNGDIRGVHTYEEAFSNNEIQAHYTSGVP